MHIMTSSESASDAGTEQIRAPGVHERWPRQLRCRFDVDDPYDGVVGINLNGGRRSEHDRTVEGSGRLKESKESAQRLESAYEAHG